MDFRKWKKIYLEKRDKVCEIQKFREKKLKFQCNGGKNLPTRNAVGPCVNVPSSESKKSRVFVVVSSVTMKN